MRLQQRQTRSSLVLLQLLGALMISFTACSNLNQVRRLEDESETLRSLSETLAESVPWTEELESNRLTTSVATSDGIEKRVTLSPLSVLAGSAETEVPPQYPALDGLGSLNQSQLPPALQSLLANFCKAITTNAKADSYMAANSRYSLALFYNDVAEKLAPKKATKAQSGTAEPATDADFVSVLYGEPFIAVDFCQIPVRFFGPLANVDVALFFILENDAWKVDQIRLCRWELHTP